MEQFVGFKRTLHRAGMSYAGFNLLSRGRYDRQVAKAIAAATTTTPPVELSKRVVESLLLQLFADAADLVAAQQKSHRGGKGSSFTDEFFNLMESLQPVSAWSKALSEPIFIELFARLSNARASWRRSPTHPYEEHQHCDLAKAIDRFNRVAGGDEMVEWAKGGLEIYELAGGLMGADKDDSSDEEAEANVDLMDVDVWTAVDQQASDSIATGLAAVIEEVTEGIKDMELDSRDLRARQSCGQQNEIRPTV